jgi:hypothetical protein
MTHPASLLRPSWGERSRHRASKELGERDPLAFGLGFRGAVGRLVQ